MRGEGKVGRNIGLNIGRSIGRNIGHNIGRKIARNIVCPWGPRVHFKRGSQGWDATLDARLDACAPAGPQSAFYEGKTQVLERDEEGG